MSRSGAALQNLVLLPIMDALVLVRSISFTISIIGAIYYRASTSYRRYISPNSYRNKRYVRWQALLLSPIIDFDQLEQTEASLCLLSDEDIVKWKDSYVSICNTVGVAVSTYSMLSLLLLAQRTNNLRVLYSVKWH